eukprot:2370-Pyramimonas_sp.AAC.1
MDAATAAATATWARHVPLAPALASNAPFGRSLALDLDELGSAGGEVVPLLEAVRQQRDECANVRLVCSDRWQVVWVAF